MPREESLPPEPQPIRRLQESVINRIAAGEIIHRPSSALKELIENSLDAGSTSIRVTVKDGGMKLLQIQDNGCGIRTSDLPILAERFTTSKISSFSDLSKLTTYGFRGEALASISYVSHLSVVTKTKAEMCAWKAYYADGALIPAKEGMSPDPKPSAGNDGTTITVENLFYNTPTRLSALRGSSEEYARILDVVTKYAIHNPSVAFTCKKAGSPTPDITTPSGSNIKQAIKQLYGQTIAKDLVHVNTSSDDNEDEDEDEYGENSWTAEAYFTNANYQSKKTIFLLFINHRLVESSRIKKSLDSIYNGILPKGTSPFMYLSLQLDPRSVDVNVHPTKREVHFLNEEAIIEQISTKILETLVGQSQSRVFEYQTLLTGGIAPVQSQMKDKGKGKEREKQSEEGEDEVGSGSSAISTPATLKKISSQHKVRNSTKDRTLDSMFPILASQQQKPTQGDPSTPAARTPGRIHEIKESECYLSSVKSLRAEVGKVKHNRLTDVLANHIFVGIVDMDKCLSLIQHEKELYLVNHGALAEELFYQLGLRQFGNFNRIRLDPPPPLRTLIELAVDVEETVKKTKLSKSKLVDTIVDLLIERREMIDEYFSLSVSDDGNVESIPLLLRDYTPNLDKLPLFLMRLGPQVNWNSEKECFETFLRELAFFYVPEPLIPSDSQSSSTSDKASSTAASDEVALRWQLQHALFPAISRYLVAPKTLLDRDVVQIASLPDLYKVFERC
ncbi:DNA binding protein [Abortiporus biennis]|nr:DNA binding protein [Abortiporus biennis]